MEKTETGDVYRSIDELTLSEEARALANKLLQNIDMNVVYLMNSNRSYNYRNRHSLQHNSFWITIKTGTDQTETERLILAGLYVASTESKRAAKFDLTENYRKVLMSAGNKQRVENVRTLISKINSAVVTLETNCFLAKYGFQTKSENMNKRFSMFLSEFSGQIQRMKINRNSWPKEIELCYIIDGGYFSEYSSTYQKQIDIIVNQIPKTTIKYYFKNYLAKVIEIFAKARREFTNEENDARETALSRMRELFKLQDRFEITYPFCFAGQYPVSLDSREKVISFVPEEDVNADFITKCFIIANECIIGIQNMFLTKNITAADPHLNLIQSNMINAYSDGSKQEGYYISVTFGLLFEISKRIYTLIKDYPSECDEIITKDEMYDKWFKYTLYWVIAHEFAHIMNGDCDRHSLMDTETVSAEQRRDEDAKADEMSEEMVFAAAALRPERHKEAVNHKNSLSRKDMIDLFIIQNSREIAQGLRC